MIDDYRRGDIALTNDPYSGFVCTHTPDMHIWKPIFHGDEIVAFSVGHIHNTDVGGAVPASLSRTLSEVHQEGVRVPPAKILVEGELDRQVLDFFLTNVPGARTELGGSQGPDRWPATLASARSTRVIARFGADVFREGVADLLDYAEAQARAIVLALPDGTYPFADYMDEDSIDGWPCRLKLTLVIDGDELVFDFTGSDPQLESSLNIPDRRRRAPHPPHGRHDLRSLLARPFALSQYGVGRVCRCILPSGTIVNPTFPAAVGMRTPLVQPAPGAHPRRLRPGRPGAARRNRRGRAADHERQHHRQPHRPAHHGRHQPDDGGRGRSRGRRRPGRLRRQPGLPQEHPVEINEAEAGIKVLRYGLARTAPGRGCTGAVWPPR